MSQPLTSVAEDYLKVVWSAQEWSQDEITTSLLAGRLGVAPSTASEAVRRLTAQGLLEHARYGTIRLTDAGRTHALAVVRRHRLIETYLVQALGYGWDEVHEEAEVLEHAVSDKLVDRIDALLGHPARDPHGDPIPTLDGEVATPDARRLDTVAPGEAGTVARLSDADGEALRWFAEVGLTLDARLDVVDRREFLGTLSLRLDDGSPLELGLVAARAVWVAPALSRTP